MDIKDVVNNQMNALVENGTVEAMVKESLTTCIKSAIDEQFCRYSSPIKKQIEELLKESVKIDISQADLAEHMSFVSDYTLNKLKSLIGDSAKEKYEQEVNKILAPLPQSMTISDFIELILSELNNDDFKDGWGDCFEVDLEKECRSYGDSYSLKISVPSDSSYRSSPEKEFHIYISEHDGDYKVRISHRMNYNPTCLDGAEAIIYKAYCQGVILTNFDDFNSYNLDLEIEKHCEC